MGKYSTLTLAEDVLALRIGQMYVNECCKRGAFKIPVHMAMGHEAIAVAVDAVMKEQDQAALTHRNLHYNMARTKSLKAEVKELLLSKDGLAGGKLGSQNLMNPDKGVAYTSNILANSMAVGAGLALGHRVKCSEGVVFITIGDGAIEEGTFFESLLFMNSQELAAVVIIENNGWSLATQIHERRSPIDVGKVADGLGIQHENFFGNDVVEYSERLEKVREYAAQKNKCAIVEVELTTLGDSLLSDPEHPNGKFINYHAGPAPTVELSEWPVIREADDDPVHVLLKRFERCELQESIRKILENVAKVDDELHHLY